MLIKRLERPFQAAIWLSALIYLFVILSLIAYILYKGLPVISTRLIFGDVPVFDALLMKRQVFDGILPAIAGTGFLVALSTLLSVPLGIGAGIYLSEYARHRAKKPMLLILDTLASIPSVVIGIFGLTMIILINKTMPLKVYPSLLIASISMSALMVPYIINATMTALHSVPYKIRITAISMGASPLQNLVNVLLPFSKPAIMSGVLLAIARCASDVAVIMLTGAVASFGIPKSILSPFEALPFFIFYVSTEYRNERQLLDGYGAAIILLTVCILLFAVSHILSRFAGGHLKR